MKHMKHAKRLIAVVLSVILVLAMGTVMAFADEVKGSITVTNPSNDATGTATTYEAYRIFDVTPAGATNTDGSFAGVTYTIAEKWNAFFATEAPGAAYIVDVLPEGKTYPQIIVGGATKYIAVDDGSVAAFAKAAFEYSQKNKIAPDASNTTGKFTDLALGYYMVYPKGASVNSEGYTTIVSLTTTNPSQNIVQKATFPTISKVDDDESVELGQVVNYTVTGQVPNTSGFTTYDYTITDTMTAGLTFDPDSVKVFIDNTEITENFTKDTTTAGGKTFSVTIDVMKYQDKVGKEIRVTYTATVNSAAVATVSKNHVTLTYSNDPKNSESKTTTPAIEQTVYSAKLNITKVDGKDSTKKLSGAQFVLKCTGVTETQQTGTKPTAEAGKYYSIGADGKVSWVAITDLTALGSIPATAIKTSDENGALSFDGLEDGTYELYEVKAPDGYNRKDGVLATITIKGNNDADLTDLTYSRNVENNQGSMLPTTGGIGTTVFYILGSVLVLIAVVQLIARKRMSSKN